MIQSKNVYLLWLVCWVLREQWDALEVKWLERTGGKIFHAADCESDHGEFKGIPHEDNLKLYRDLVTIIVNSSLSGFGVVMDLKAYQICFPHSLDYVAYIHCFRRVIEKLAANVHLLIPRGTTKFVFDNNEKIRYTATQLYEIYSNNPQWQYSEYLVSSGIQYAFKRDFVGLQAADLYAREVMKDGDNYFKYLNNESNRFNRASFRRLRETHKFGIAYYTKEYWEDYKKKSPDIEKEEGLSKDDYITWLAQEGLVDNLPNRTHFLKFINEQSNLKQDDEEEPSEDL